MWASPLTTELHTEEWLLPTRTRPPETHNLATYPYLSICPLCLEPRVYLLLCLKSLLSLCIFYIPTPRPARLGRLFSDVSFPATSPRPRSSAPSRAIGYLKIARVSAYLPPAIATFYYCTTMGPLVSLLLLGCSPVSAYSPRHFVF